MPAANSRNAGIRNPLTAQPAFCVLNVLKEKLLPKKQKRVKYSMPARAGRIATLLSGINPPAKNVPNANLRSLKLKKEKLSAPKKSAVIQRNKNPGLLWATLRNKQIGAFNKPGLMAAD